ncbi:MAG: ornithine carbamoyltransferase [Candidatus Verstraetearchaeota archaeon]|nr:ornithine carbamoyltransferase [Candidatus Verstraetearchaeota archaeon]
MDLIGRDFLRTKGFSADELKLILDRASEMKSALRRRMGTPPYLEGKSIAMLFQKPSTRTRISFDVGVYQLGGHPIYLNWADLQLGRGETVSDTGRILGCYVDGIVARVFKHSDLEVLADSSPAPVINALSDEFHPCQALSDCLTILERKGRIEGVSVVFVGDGRSNVCQSLAEAVLQLGGNITVSSPAKYMPTEEFVKELRGIAGKGGKIRLVEDPFEAVKGADVIYTDVWVSMGFESEAAERRSALGPYQVNSGLMRSAPPDAIVMHCLPAHRGEEITSEVIDGPRSAVWEQAENRLHVQKSIMSLIF